MLARITDLVNGVITEAGGEPITSSDAIDLIGESLSQPPSARLCCPAAPPASRTRSTARAAGLKQLVHAKHMLHLGRLQWLSCLSAGSHGHFAPSAPILFTRPRLQIWAGPKGVLWVATGCWIP